MNITLFDVTAIVAALAGCLLGYESGFFAGIFVIAAGFVGIWAAQTPAVQMGLPPLIAFFGAALPVVIVGIVVSRIFRSFLPEFIDHMLGIMLGAVMGAMLIFAGLVPLSRQFPKVAGRSAAKSFTRTVAMPWVKKHASWVLGLDLGSNDLFVRNIIHNAHSPSIDNVRSKLHMAAQRTKDMFDQIEPSDDKQPDAAQDPAQGTQ